MSANQWGQAKVEVLALASAIQKRKKEGYSIRRIWAELRDAGHVTVSLRAFSRQIEQQLSRSRATTLSASATPLPRSAQKSLNLPAVVSQRPDDALADGRFPGFVRVPAIQGQMKLLTPDQLKERKDED